MAAVAPKNGCVTLNNGDEILEVSGVKEVCSLVISNASGPADLHIYRSSDNAELWSYNISFDPAVVPYFPNHIVHFYTSGGIKFDVGGGASAKIHLYLAPGV